MNLEGLYIDMISKVGNATAFVDEYKPKGNENGATSFFVNACQKTYTPNRQHSHKRVDTIGQERGCIFSAVA